MTTKKHHRNPTASISAANRAARYRSVVRLYVEALVGGALDESLVPEIEVAFVELGRMAGLDFEEVRRELGQAKPRVKQRAKRKETLAEKDVRLLDSLPGMFTWKDVADLWDLSRTAAFKRLQRLLEKDLIYGAGSGSYRVSARREQVFPTKPSPKKVSPEKVSAKRKTHKLAKTPTKPEKREVGLEKVSLESGLEKVSAESSADSLIIESHTDKSFVVRGDTRPFKDQLGRKGLGGKWKPKLRGGMGWLFRTEDLPRVQAWIETVRSGAVPQAAPTAKAAPAPPAKRKALGLVPDTENDVPAPFSRRRIAVRLDALPEWMRELPRTPENALHSKEAAAAMRKDLKKRSGN